MGKIALVCTPTMANAYHELQDFVAILPPSGMLSVAGALEKAGNEVIFFDADGLGWDFETCLKEVLAVQPDYVGITAMTATVDIASNFCKRLKEINPKIITIFGGIHATAMPLDTIERYPYVDYVVKGEAEFTAPKLLKALDDGDTPDELEGVTFRKGSGIIDNPRPDIIRNLDDIPMPAYHLLDHSRYRSYGWNGWTGVARAPIGAVYTARGCYRNCTFCSSKVVLGRGIRTFSEARVMEEIKLMVEKYKIKVLYLQDDTFCVNKKRSMSIADEILRRGYKLKIMIAARCDEVDEELYRKLKEAGVDWCCYGVESGNQQILNSINKNITLDNVYHAFDVSNRVGFHVGGNFMLGFPEETWDTAMDTINLAASRLKMDYASFALCIPFPGTDMYEQAIKKGIKLPDWSGFGLVNSPPIPLSSLSVDELYKLRRIATVRFFANPRYLLRLLGKFNKGIILKDFFKTGKAIAKEMMAKRY